MAAPDTQPTPDQRRRELGELLRSRREQVDRASLNLPPATRTRTPGLRREEVAFLSGVSLTWYTWLEQGRDINPSRQVLDAVARTLRLSTAEHGYVLSLAGFSAPPPTTSPADDGVTPHLQRLLDHLDPAPAFVLAADWRIVGWNAAYAGLVPHVADLEPTERNLLLLVFTDPWVRALLPHWPTDSRRFLAEFRAEAGPRLGTPEVVDLVERLTARSPEFRAWWDARDVEGFTTRERLFTHPDAGELRLEHHRLAPEDHPGLHLVLYTPRDEETRDRLARLTAT